MQIEDQATQLRRLMLKRLMPQPRNTRTIAVTSGKGGVGKSNVALNLAIMLSAGGNRVALVDADLGLANLDVLIDMDIRSNLSHVISGGKRLEDVIVDLPCGVQFVPGASGLARIAHLSEFQRAQLLRELSTLESDNDFIIVDTGAGIGPEVLHFAASADSVLVVTTPEPPAITDAYAMIKVLSQMQYRGTISVLVNFAKDRHDGRDTFARISSVARKFLGVKVYDGGFILADEKVSQAVRTREPFVLAYPKCDAAKCLAAVATKLFSSDVYSHPKAGFFGRVANWFV